MKSIRLITRAKMINLIIISILICIVSACSTKTTAQQATPRLIKIALLLDTSNSMDGLIDQAKSQLWQLVNELAVAKCDGVNPNLEIALYEYGNDRLSAREGYIRQVTPLTNDLDQISEDLFGLTTDGGSEFCGWVIQSALNQQDWSNNDNDLQIIFIAGNEPFNQGSVDFKKSCSTAKEKNVIVNTIFCGNFDEGLSSYWKQGADLAGGQYMCIEQDRKTVYISSPYDDKITELNKELNKTYLGYGRIGEQKKVAQIQQDSNASRYDKANMVKRAVSKSSHFYKNSTWDVVDACKNDAKFLSDKKDEELPKELQGLTLSEKVKYVENLSIKRESINKQIKELNTKREAYVSKQNQSENSDNMLDKAMVSAIIKQAQQKGFTF